MKVATAWVKKPDHKWSGWASNVKKKGLSMSQNSNPKILSKLNDSSEEEPTYGPAHILLKPYIPPMHHGGYWNSGPLFSFWPCLDFATVVTSQTPFSSFWEYEDNDADHRFKHLMIIHYMSHFVSILGNVLLQEKPGVGCMTNKSTQCKSHI